MNGSIDALLESTAGLALANAAFHEGLRAGIRACNDADNGRVFTKPVSPYSAPLLSAIKARTPQQLQTILTDQKDPKR